jgi:hypothetical protein
MQWLDMKVYEGFLLLEMGETLNIVVWWNVFS